MNNTHSKASSIVKTWRAPIVANWASEQVLGKTMHAVTLAYPGEGYRVAVTFSTVQGQPEWVRVRATNWRCEDEPNGVYAASAAREFYRTLLAAGFVKEGA